MILKKPYIDFLINVHLVGSEIMIILMLALPHPHLNPYFMLKECYYNKSYFHIVTCVHVCL
jgi:hypothetical protein